MENKCKYCHKTYVYSTDCAKRRPYLKVYCSVACCYRDTQEQTKQEESTQKEEEKPIK